MNIVIDIGVGFYQRRLLSGIFEFFGDRQDITLYVPNFPLANQTLPSSVDGILGVQHHNSHIWRMVGKGIPGVNLTSRPRNDSVQVCTDSTALSRMAFDHFRECNVNTLAFCLGGSGPLSTERLQAYSDVCEEEGVPLHVLNTGPGYSKGIGSSLLEALAALPRPAGILLTVDALAPDFMDCCRQLNLRIPEDIQIVGINNDVRFCSSCTPTLSSIDIRPEQIGYEGARALMALLEGRAVDAIIRAPPAELVQRGTTTRNTGLSPIVNRAVEFMHANMGQRIEMADLVALADTGRRYLENRFAEDLGCSPMRHLRSIRLQRIQFLLKATDMTVVEIGKQCGIPNITYLCRLFRKHHGVTPRQYRARA